VCSAHCPARKSNHGEPYKNCILYLDLVIIWVNLIDTLNLHKPITDDLGD